MKKKVNIFKEMKYKLSTVCFIVINLFLDEKCDGVRLKKVNRNKKKKVITRRKLENSKNWLINILKIPSNDRNRY